MLTSYTYFEAFLCSTAPLGGPSILLKRAANLAKASGSSGKETIGSVTKKQVEEIAKLKLADLNTDNLEQAMKVIEGTARSMGIAVEG